ncbi:molybdopterin converting factor subunit 1 [Uliginosibacterium sp. sgz301328]|uniref:molybdopterin converting factor subunit 1 n=1 Tax=Uliginosibacterium sp. sgz301328 TaxID=3243764 RepID=UPI00359D8E06
MNVTVLFFASLREALGVERERIALEAGATVDSLRALLIARGEQWQPLSRGSVRAAVNQSLVTGANMLADGDEVAFFPPVTGG